MSNKGIREELVIKWKNTLGKICIIVMNFFSLENCENEFVFCSKSQTSHPGNKPSRKQTENKA